jgi:hypothetical protein
MRSSDVFRSSDDFANHVERLEHFGRNLMKHVQALIGQ